jgi:hypothetical protein
MTSQLGIPDMTRLVHDAAIAVRAALGSDWRYDESLDGDKRPTPYARVRNGDQTICLFGDCYRNRISIKASWDALDPNGKRIDTHYDQPEVSITVAPTKAPKAIAADVLRRFMPAYNAAWPKYESAIKATRSYLASVLANSMALTASPYFRPVDNRYGNRSENERVASVVDGIDGVRCHASGVSMTLRDLTPAEAIAIAAIVKGG